MKNIAKDETKCSISRFCICSRSEETLLHSSRITKYLDRYISEIFYHITAFPPFFKKVTITPFYQTISQILYS
jgi:hypothetical protein